MSELSPKAEALVHSGRAALRPTGQDRARVLTGLRARIAAPIPTPAPRGPWLLASAALVSAGVAAAIGLSSKPSVDATAPRSAPALPAPAAVSSAAPQAPATLPKPAPPAAALPSAAAARRAPDRLAEEVAILSHAAKDLRAGRAAEALRALNDHQRRFPGGLLTVERRAARAEALCSLGRFAEADAELSTLTRAAPSSPLTVRAQQRCARPVKPR